jgi:hypothetical protein
MVRRKQKTPLDGAFLFGCWICLPQIKRVKLQVSPRAALKEFCNLLKNKKHRYFTRCGQWICQFECIAP